MARRLNDALDNERIAKLVRAGWSDSAIAMRLGCGHTTVGYRRQQMGLPRNFDTRGKPVDERGRVTRANVGD